MNDFTKNIAQALFNQDKINDLLRQEIERAVNDLLEAELTAFLGYDPYARSGWNFGNSRNGAYYRKIDTHLERLKSKYREIAMASFTSILCPIINSTQMS